jgi:hypothetical protein
VANPMSENSWLRASWPRNPFAARLRGCGHSVAR